MIWHNNKPAFSFFNNKASITPEAIFSSYRW